MIFDTYRMRDDDDLCAERVEIVDGKVVVDVAQHVAVTFVVTEVAVVKAGHLGVLFHVCKLEFLGRGLCRCNAGCNSSARGECDQQVSTIDIGHGISPWVQPTIFVCASTHYMRGYTRTAISPHGSSLRSSVSRDLDWTPSNRMTLRMAQTTRSFRTKRITSRLLSRRWPLPSCLDPGRGSLGGGGTSRRE